MSVIFACCAHQFVYSSVRGVRDVIHRARCVNFAGSRNSLVRSAASIGYLCVAHNLLFLTICVIYTFGWVLRRLGPRNWIFQFFSHPLYVLHGNAVQNTFIIISINRYRHILYINTRITELQHLSRELQWIERSNRDGLVLLAGSLHRWPARLLYKLKIVLPSCSYMLKHHTAPMSLKIVVRELLKQDDQKEKLQETFKM